MAGLSINGVEIPCLASGGIELDEDPVGAGLDRNQDGSTVNNFQDIKRRVVGKSSPLLQDDAAFCGAMLKGLGDHYTFDADASSDKGLSPALATGFSITAVTPVPKYGAGALLVDANAAHTMTFTLAKNFLEGFTVALWVAQSDVGSNAWHHYVLTVGPGGSTLSAWVDGAYQGPIGTPAWFGWTASTGQITLKGRTAGTTTFDDMWAVPAHASETSPRRAIAGLYAFMNASALPTPWPRMTVGGTFHPTTMTMEGKVTKSAQSVGALGTGYSENLRSLEFELWE